MAQAVERDLHGAHFQRDDNHDETEWRQECRSVRAGGER